MQVINKILEKYKHGQVGQVDLEIFDYKDEFKNAVEWGYSYGLYKDYHIGGGSSETESGDDEFYNVYEIKQVQWRKVFEIANTYYDKLVTDPTEMFKLNKQKSILCEALLQKKNKVEDNEFVFTEKNLSESSPKDYQSVSLSKTFYSIVRDKNIKVLNIHLQLLEPRDIESKKHFYEIKIKLLGLLSSGINPYLGSSSEESRSVIYISKDHGIYKLTADNKKVMYPISGKRGGLLYKLKNGKVAGALLSKKLSLLSKEVGAINKAFQKNLKLDDKKDVLIIRIPTGGYSLNNDRFKILFAE
jgi:hypothetical protein